MKFLRGVILALPLFAFLPGCPIYTGDRDDGPRRECDRSSDCRSGEICSDAGRCVPAPECRADDDCDAGEVCTGGTCVPEGPPPSCAVHGDCRPGLMCDAGTCVPSDRCSDDDACEDGFWCDFRGTCVPRPDGACRTHDDCDGSDLCIEGYCRSLDDTCARDRDCAPGNVCLNNECTSLCDGDAACAPGDSCQGGYCRPDTSECTTSSDCASGEHCTDGRCLPGCGASGDSACVAGSYCGAEDSLCRPDWEPQPFCVEDADCQSGRRCVAGVCRTPCPTMTDAECLTIDAQLPLCREDGGTYYCFATSETMPAQCRVQADCSDGRDCVNGSCRNRS